MPEHEGMASREDWEQTEVHKASTYWCGKCGQQFASPHDFYEHLDKEHPSKKEPRRRGNRND